MAHEKDDRKLSPFDLNSALKKCGLLNYLGDVEEIDTFAPPRQDWIDGTDDYLKK